MKNMVVIQGSATNSQRLVIDGKTGRRPVGCLNDLVYRAIQSMWQCKLYPSSLDNFALIDFEVGIIRL